MCLVKGQLSYLFQGARLFRLVILFSRISEFSEADGERENGENREASSTSKKSAASLDPQ